MPILPKKTQENTNSIAENSDNSQSYPSMETLPLVDFPPKESPSTKIAPISPDAEIQAAASDDCEYWTQKFNTTGYKHAFIGGKERVIKMIPAANAYTSKADAVPLKMEFMERTAFINKYAHMKKIQSEVDQTGKPVFKKPAQVWIENESRNIVNGVCFNPEQKPLTINEYDQFNLYQGRAVNPSDCDINESYEFLKPFLSHLYNNLCKRDKNAYSAFINVMAAKYQNPTIKPYAVIIHGVEGTGKDTIVEPFMRLYGAHGKKATKAEEVIGTYNANTLSGCLFLWMDEAFAGTKEATDCMKTVVFTEELSLNDKFTPAWRERILNQTILTTNRENMIRFAVNDRRYFVLEMSDEMVGNHEYFKGLWELIDHKDFLHHLANYLLKTDISKFNYRKPPMTKSKAIQILSTAEPEQRFAFKVIAEGGLRLLSISGSPEGEKPIINWPEKMHTDEIAQAFTHWLRDNRIPFGKQEKRSITATLQNFGFKRERFRINNENRWGLIFPEHKKAVEEMEKMLGIKIGDLEID